MAMHFNKHLVLFSFQITITREGSSCLKKYLPEEILPLDYGGKEKSSSELNGKNSFHY